MPFNPDVLESSLLTRAIPNYRPVGSDIDRYILETTGEEIDSNKVADGIAKRRNKYSTRAFLHMYNQYFLPQVGDIVCEANMSPSIDHKQHGIFYKVQWSGKPSKVGFQRNRIKIKCLSESRVRFADLANFKVVVKAPSTDSELCNELFGNAQAAQNGFKWYDESTWRPIPVYHSHPDDPFKQFPPDRYLSGTYMMRQATYKARAGQMTLKLRDPAGNPILIPFHHTQQILMQGGKKLYTQDLFAEHRMARVQHIGNILIAYSRGAKPKVILDDRLRPLEFLDQITNRAGTITMSQYAYDKFINISNKV